MHRSRKCSGSLFVEFFQKCVDLFVIHFHLLEGIFDVFQRLLSRDITSIAVVPHCPIVLYFPARILHLD